MSAAITQALTVLGFMELQDKDRPDEALWLDQDKLALHFNEVRERWSSGSSSGPEWEEIEGSVAVNEEARELRRRVEQQQ